MALEVVDVEMLVDPLLGRARERGRVDDAIVVELITDHSGLVGHQRWDYSHDGGVGGREQHGGGAAMERGEPLFQRDVRRGGPADEAYCAWAGAVALRGCFFRDNEL